MYVEIESIITLSKVLTALGVIGGLGWKLFGWVQHQKDQDRKITDLDAKIDNEVKNLTDKYDKEIKGIKTTQTENQREIQEEQQLIVYGLLACLKGLQEQGAGSSVADAINKIEKHINQKAHE